MKINYALVNFIFLAIAPISYFCPNFLSYVLSCLSWLIFYPVFILICKLDPLNSFLSVLVFNGLQFAFMAIKNTIHKDQEMFELQIKDDNERHKGLSEELEKLNRFESGMQRKELVIANIYDITKRMSENLKFNEIFDVFSAFLKENFEFRKCDLLILNFEGQEPYLDRKYSVYKKEVKDKRDEAVDYNRIIKLFLQNPKEVYISRDTQPQNFKDLGIEDEEVKTYVRMPLLSEQKVVAILAVENLDKDELEKFVILSMQFALEIKKVLLYETVERLAITDSLTGLYMRRYFYERLKEELRRSKRYKIKFAFLMMDIDDFKRCNDTSGHLVGDVILKDISRIIKQNVREIDLVARYGGEEFAVILPETALEGARLAGERIRKKIEENIFKAYDETLRITLSIGMAIYPDDADEIDELIEKADMALYAAKKMGKNLVCEYKKEYNNDLI